MLCRFKCNEVATLFSLLESHAANNAESLKGDALMNYYHGEVRRARLEHNLEQAIEMLEAA